MSEGSYRNDSLRGPVFGDSLMKSIVNVNGNADNDTLVQSSIFEPSVPLLSQFNSKNTHGWDQKCKFSIYFFKYLIIYTYCYNIYIYMYIYIYIYMYHFFVSSYVFDNANGIQVVDLAEIFRMH